jgi:hypothetical protein
VLQTLQHSPGQHLAVVRYSKTHNFDHEWVYNSADIDASKVIWAREMDPQSNQELLHYFKNRHIWLIEPDQSPPRISPYPLTIHVDSTKSQMDSEGVAQADSK